MYFRMKPPEVSNFHLKINLRDETFSYRIVGSVVDLAPTVMRIGRQVCSIAHNGSV